MHYIYEIAWRQPGWEMHSYLKAVLIKPKTDIIKHSTYDSSRHTTGRIRNMRHVPESSCHTQQSPHTQTKQQVVVPKYIAKKTERKRKTKKNAKKNEK